jgi:hypothetical protein
MSVPAKHPYSDQRREQHPVESVKTWPNQPLKAPQQLPGAKKGK